MSEPGSPKLPEEALLDLLTKQLTDGLLLEERRALDSMDSALAIPYAQDFERAAAAISLAASDASKEMPSPGLRSRIEKDAQAFFIRPHSASRMSVAGWYAAAACLVLAMFGWLRVPQAVTAPPTANAPESATSLVLPPVTAPEPRTPAEERAALRALSGSVIVDLSPTKDPAAAGVSADVVWDPSTQRGFMRFAGLRSNDPRVQQYQAWIFDAARDKRYPLDAGVFDVPADSSEVIVPIHSALAVHAAKAFAVTLERPGGVVVSALHHVVVLGSVI